MSYFQGCQGVRQRERGRDRGEQEAGALQQREEGERERGERVQEEKVREVLLGAAGPLLRRGQPGWRRLEVRPLLRTLELLCNTHTSASGSHQCQ